MNAAAQELALRGVAKRRERVRAVARPLCEQMGRPVPGALLGELLLTERAA